MASTPVYLGHPTKRYSIVSLIRKRFAATKFKDTKINVDTHVSTQILSRVYPTKLYDTPVLTSFEI